MDAREDNPKYDIPNVAEIYINGVEITDIIRPIEQPYAEQEGHPELAGDYGHNPSGELHKMLENALIEGTYEAEEGVELLCCRGCGECGCWSIEVYMKEDDKFVYWYKIKHNHREWKYDLTFKFEKEAYHQALKVLVQ